MTEKPPAGCESLRSQNEAASSDHSGAEQGGASGRAKPIHEVRLGRVKAVIWANRIDVGVRHNVTVRRLFKRNGSDQWEQSDSFGRDDLPLVMEVTRAAWLWIFANAQKS